MGGGDLNMKKSWHPSTKRNMERVWLAEQAAGEEEKRLEQLRNEIREEKDRDQWLRIQEEAGLIKKREARLDWMYQGPDDAKTIAEEREAFLLGRKRIDEINPSATNGVSGDANTAQTEGGFASANGDRFKGITTENQQRDMQNKLREDPLFAIKMREKQIISALHQPTQNSLSHSQSNNSRVISDKPKDKRRRSRSPAAYVRRRSRDRRRSRSRSRSRDRDRSRDRHHRSDRHRSGKDRTDRNRYERRHDDRRRWSRSRSPRRRDKY